MRDTVPSLSPLTSAFFLICTDQVLLQLISLISRLPLAQSRLMQQKIRLKQGGCTLPSCALKCFYRLRYVCGVQNSSSLDCVAIATRMRDFSGSQSQTGELMICHCKCWKERDRKRADWWGEMETNRHTGDMVRGKQRLKYFMWFSKVFYVH